MAADIKIRVRLKSYDYKVLDQTVEEIVDAVFQSGAEVVGPIPLPTDIEKYTVIRGPHIDKRSQETFEQRTHKRLLDIVNPGPKTLDSLANLDLPAGVSVEIKM